MPKVIRLHKDDEILFIREQKRILSLLNSPEETNVAFPFFPLLVELNDAYFERKTVLQLKKSFEKIQVENAALSENEIFCAVKIKMTDGFESAGKLLLGTCKKNPENRIFFSSEKDFFKEIKIFQLAEEKKSGIQTELWNSQWCRCGGSSA